jgi:hypothetical protein
MPDNSSNYFNIFDELCSGCTRHFSTSAKPLERTEHKSLFNIASRRAALYIEVMLQLLQRESISFNNWARATSTYTAAARRSIQYVGSGRCVLAFAARCTLNIQRCANIYYLRTHPSVLRQRESSAACMRVQRERKSRENSAPSASKYWRTPAPTHSLVPAPCV